LGEPGQKNQRYGSVGEWLEVSRIVRGVQIVCVGKYRRIPTSHGPQFDTAELDVMSAFENIFDICR
jgi:hypothetical protein